MAFSEEQASQEQEDYFAEQVDHFREQAENLNEQADDLLKEADELGEQAEDFMEQAKEAKKEAGMLVQQAGFYRKQAAYCQQQEKLAAEQLQASREEPAGRPLVILKGEDDDNKNNNNNNNHKGNDSKINTSSPFGASSVTIADEPEDTVGGLWLTTDLCESVESFIRDRHAHVGKHGLASLPRLESLNLPLCQPSKKRPDNLAILSFLNPLRQRYWPDHSLTCQDEQVERLYRIYACAVHAFIGRSKALGLMGRLARTEVSFDNMPLWDEAATTECRCRDGRITFYRAEQARCPDTGNTIVGWVPLA